MRHLITATALLFTLLATPLPAGQGPPPGTARDLVGTWTLVSVERPGAGGPTALAQPRGLLVFDAAGHVFEAVAHAVPRVAGAPALTEAQARFAGFGGFWGRYVADAAGGRLALHANGAVSPNLQGRDFARSYEITPDGRLALTALSGQPHTPSGTRWVWERVPVVENLSPGYRQVVGFWQHVVEKRVNLTTGAAPETTRAPSIIVYSPSGYVGVHFPPLNRKPFAGDEPTDEEARAALQGYVGYFGALTVYPGMVFHHLLSTSGLAVGTLKRFYEMAANEVTIKFPIVVNAQGQQTTTHVILRRLSGVGDMLPAS